MPSRCLLAASAALRSSAPTMISDLFTRSGPRQGAMFGTSELRTAEAAAVLERALPA